jgi:hypothetical protein
MRAAAVLCVGLSFAGAFPAPAQYRPPIDLQIPQVRAEFSDADVYETPDQTPSRLLVRVRHPLATNFQRISLILNGQAVTFATTVSEVTEGKLAELNLRLRQTVRLQRGSNVLEIVVVDRRGRHHYRGFIIKTREASRNRYFAYETRGDGPEVKVLEPLGPVVFLGQEQTLEVPVRVQVSGRRPLATVTMNGEAQRFDVDSGQFAAKLELSRTSGPIGIVAADAEGNRTVVTIPVSQAISSKPPPPAGRRFALVVGVGRYPGGAAGTGNLEAKAFTDILVKRAGFPAENVKLLVDEQATATQLRAALETHVSLAGEGDLLVIYFAGHGLNDPDQPEEGYLAVGDSVPPNWKATALSINDLRQLLKNNIRTSRALLFFDVSRPLPAGWTPPDLNLVNGRLAGLASDLPGVSVLVASAVGQPSVDRGAAVGLFTQVLIDGFQGQADLDRDGIVSAQELFDYVCQAVLARSDGHQEPFYHRAPQAAGLASAR